MIRVGLVGEDPNDTSSIKNLLDQRYKGRVQFHTLAKNITGWQLDSPKLKKILPIEFAEKKCKYVVFTRDLDALQSNKAELLKKQAWFDELNLLVKNNGVFLLNIWELEALILGDIETFNTHYGQNHKVKTNPMFQKDPKEHLKRITANSNKKFHENHCPKIFKKLSIDNVEANCSCFKTFIQDFEHKIA